MRCFFLLFITFSAWAQPDPVWRKLMVVPPLNVPLLSGLILHYSFEQFPNSTTVQDTSGNGYNGTESSSGVWRTPGVSGVSLWCVTNDSGHAMYSPSITYATNQITVTLWVYTPVAPFSTAWILFESSDLYSSHNNTFIVDWSSSNGIEVLLHGTANYYAEYAPVATGVWNHYAFLFDGSTSAGLVKVYTNHVLQTVQSLPQNNASFSGNFAVFPVNITARNQSGGIPSLNWPGAIDDFRIYPGILTSNQVYQVYANPL